MVRPTKSTLFAYTTLFRSLVANVVAVYGFITNNEANNISGISQLRARGQVHRQVETGVEQEGFQKCGSYLLLQWVITDRKSTRLNSSHVAISYAVFCLYKK